MFRTFALASFGLLLIQTGLLWADEPVTDKAKSEKKEDDVKWTSLFDGKTLEGWKSANFGGEGEVSVKDGQIFLNMGDPITGITYQKGKELPLDNYEIRLDAMRVDGGDFFCGLTFPVGKSHCSFIVGGWGGGVVGLSSINGMDASENETTKYLKVDSGQWYKIRVRVAEDKIQAWIDDKRYADVEIKDRKINTRVEVDLSKPLGISTYHTKAALKNLEIRTVEKAE